MCFCMKQSVCDGYIWWVCIWLVYYGHILKVYLQQENVLELQKYQKCSDCKVSLSLYLIFILIWALS